MMPADSNVLQHRHSTSEVKLDCCIHWLCAQVGTEISTPVRNSTEGEAKPSVQASLTLE